MNSPLPPRFEAPPPIPVSRPSVVAWYRSWCVLFAFVWLALLVYSVLKARGAIENLGIFAELLTKDDPAARNALLAEEREDAIGAAFLSGMGMLFYVFAACVPRRPWSWVIGMIALIGSIFPFCISVAGAAPLLMFWVKPEAKLYFGKRP